MIQSIFQQVQAKHPLVHNITNYVTVNDCANITLAAGGSPIMADDINEVEDIISICDALVINIGTLNERTIASMFKAGKKANQLNKPVILDPVGAGASSLRTNMAVKLLNEIQFAVVRGNMSEIKALALGSGTTKGVDADINDALSTENLSETVSFAQEFSRKTGAVIAMTGKDDLVACTDTAYLVHNGHSMMSKITGSGCMLTSLIGVYTGANANQILQAVVSAVALMGFAGERAYQKEIGTASFRVRLIDAVSLLTAAQLEEGGKIEII